MRFSSTETGVYLAHTLVGAALGVVVLHPVTMVVYWLELRPGSAGIIDFVSDRLLASFTSPMLPMTGLFLALGALMGGVFGLYQSALLRRRREVDSLSNELATDVQALVALGESERCEFKSTARWDLHQQKVNKKLEDVVAKTIAGFLNHSGGSLIIGVNDDGDLIGLKADYDTLKRKDRDGFEQFIMSLVKEKLGGHVCALVHPVFVRCGDTEVCRLVIEPSQRPVYCNDRGFARYFVRTGNATRELDVQEAFEHLHTRGRKRGTS